MKPKSENVPSTDPNSAQKEPQAAESTAGTGVPPVDYYDQLLRLKAEFENYRKRVDRERPEWIALGESGLLVKLLPLYDVLLQAHEQVLRISAEDKEESGSKALIQGMELIFKEFNKFLESAGVQVIETVGQPYHHDLHEVLGVVETEDYGEGIVAQEIQRGYTLHGRVLRPARVRIAKPKAK